jgi:hypothetical protein
MSKMTRRTNPIVVIKEVDMDISHIYSCNHMVGLDKISSNASISTPSIKFLQTWT